MRLPWRWTKPIHRESYLSRAITFSGSPLKTFGSLSSPTTNGLIRLIFLITIAQSHYDSEPEVWNIALCSHMLVENNRMKENSSQPNDKSEVFIIIVAESDSIGLSSRDSLLDHLLMKFFKEGGVGTACHGFQDTVGIYMVPNQQQISAGIFDCFCSALFGKWERFRIFYEWSSLPGIRNCRHKAVDYTELKHTSRM